MAELAIAVSILPGKTEAWKEFTRELEARRSEHEEVWRRLGGIRHVSWLQQTPEGDMVLVYYEAEDIDRVFQEFATSDDPLMVWFRERVKDIHGMDLSQPLPLSFPEKYMDITIGG
jgi:hypothetical protein